MTVGKERGFSARALRIVPAVAIAWFLLTLALSPASGAGLAQKAEEHAPPPRVVASIAPVQSLVAGVMLGVGEPHLLVRGGASPHSIALRPSDAVALERADLVFWIGPSLENFLERPLRVLSANARVVALSDLEGLRLLPLRENAVWGGSVHEENQQSEEDHDHGEEHHGVFDPHLWLDPRNAMQLVTGIATALAEVDPDRAAQYRANGAAVITRLQDLDRELEAQLRPLAGRPYAVFHDAFHYLEARYGLSPVGAIAISPDRRPGARRLSEVRRAIRDSAALCVFAEPQFEPKLIESAIAGTAARSAVLDPLGAHLEPGREAYFDLLRTSAAALRDCLGQDD